MTEILEMYKCNVCGNIVEVVISGAGELVCCGQPMEKMQEQNKNQEMSGEKHVPVVEKYVGHTESKSPFPYGDCFDTGW